jgi:NhaA family Na+:H+ antiporter
VSFTLAGARLGLRVPRDLGWRELLVVGAVAAIGFTVALFFATAAFPNGVLLAQAKTGALLSVLGGLVAMMLAAALHVGRFAK